MFTRIIFDNERLCKANQDTGLRKMSIASLPDLKDYHYLPEMNSISGQQIFSNATNGKKENLAYPKKKTNGIRKPRVLHVEDNNQIRFLVEVLLRKEFDVVGIGSGEKALEMIKSGEFDIILMDLNLGDGISGFETTIRIKAIGDNTKHIPVIALTANNYHDVREECIKVGMNAFIQKPFDRTDLTQTINQLIAN